VSLRTVYTVLEEAADRYGDLPALCQPAGGGNYRVYSWIEYKQVTAEIAAGLRTLGIGKGDTVALECETRAEFYLADVGILANGSVAAALYRSYPPAQHVHTLRACGAKAVFVEDSDSLRSLQTACDPPLDLYWIVLTGTAGGAMSLDELRARGRKSMEESPELFAAIRRELHPSDPAILYLTSGVTGEPKMAVVSHAALVANIDMGPSVLGLTPEDCTIAFLPAAHITQRVVLELLPIVCGMPVWFVESLGKLPHALRVIRPTIFLAPPRLWERVYTSARTEIEKRPAFARKLFYGAVGLSAEVHRREHEGRTVPRWMRHTLRWADKIAFRPIRARFGDRLRIAVSGAAPLGKQLAEFYEALGIPIAEGYGLTEGGIVALNPLDHPRAGSVGKPLPGIEVKLADDGELLVKSPSLFTGYYNDPKTTAEVKRDGWLYTGDTAEIDADGFIQITGRKKEVIIASNGKKVFPARVESLFNLEPIINHVVLFGEGQTYVSALLTVNAGVADTLKGMERLQGQVTAAPVLAEVKRAVARVNSQLAPFEQIRRYRVLDRDFTIESGELTATLKVRRIRVAENFREVIEEMQGINSNATAAGEP